MSDLENFQLLPPEERLDDRHDVEAYAEPEVLQLLEDFGLANNSSVQEIRHRVQFVTWANVYTIANWSPKDWVRHLGARTAARLAKATFWLSRWSYMEDLVRFMQEAMRNEDGGRWEYPVTKHDISFFEQEISNPNPAKQWNATLRRAIKYEISLQTAGSPSVATDMLTDYAIGSQNSQVPTEERPPFFVEVAREVSMSDSRSGAEESRVSSVPTMISQPNSSSQEQGNATTLRTINESRTTKESTVTSTTGTQSTPSPSQPRSSGGWLQPPQGETVQASSTPVALLATRNNCDPYDDDENGTPERTEMEEIQSTWRSIDFRKKCFLNLLFIVNLVAALFTLKHGFGVDVGSNILPNSDDGPSPRPPPLVFTSGKFWLLPISVFGVPSFDSIEHSQKLTCCIRYFCMPTQSQPWPPCHQSY